MKTKNVAKKVASTDGHESSKGIAKSNDDLTKQNRLNDAEPCMSNVTPKNIKATNVESSLTDESLTSSKRKAVSAEIQDNYSSSESDRKPDAIDRNTKPSTSSKPKSLRKRKKSEFEETGFEAVPKDIGRKVDLKESGDGNSAEKLEEKVPSQPDTKDDTSAMVLDIADYYKDLWTSKSLADLLQSTLSGVRNLKWSNLSDLNSDLFKEGNNVFKDFIKLISEHCPNIEQLNLADLCDEFCTNFWSSTKELSKCTAMVKITIPTFPIEALAHLPNVLEIESTLTLDSVKQCSNGILKTLSHMKQIANIDFASLQLIAEFIRKQRSKSVTIDGFRSSIPYNPNEQGYRNLATIAIVFPKAGFDVSVNLASDLSILSPIYDRIRTLDLSLCEPLNQMNEESLSQTVNLQKLKISQLLHKSARPEFFKFLENYSNLTHLAWEDVHVPSGGGDSPWDLNFDVADACRFVRANTNLECISLARCVCDPSNLESWLASNKFPLKSLTIRSCLDCHSGLPMRLSEEGLNRILGASPSLEYLMLTGCFDDAFGPIAELLPHLKRLVMRSATREGLLSFIEARKKSTNVDKLMLVLSPDSGLPRNHKGLVDAKIQLTDPISFNENLDED